jgi:DNA-binding transcriptional ArsR family regulator
MNIHRNGRTLDTMERLQQLLIALANPQRIEILLALTRGPTAVTPLADDLELDLSTVSHGLRVLRDCGLATMRREKIRHIYSTTEAVRLISGTADVGPQLHVSCPLGTVVLEVSRRYDASDPAPGSFA